MEDGDGVDVGVGVSAGMEDGDGVNGGVGVDVDVGNGLDGVGDEPIARVEVGVGVAAGDRSAVAD